MQEYPKQYYFNLMLNKRFKMKYYKMNITIEEEVYKLFKAHCQKHGYKMSTRLSILMLEEMQQKIKS